MRVLITGGCGFLGANIAAELLIRKIPVAIIDDLSRLGSAENLSWLKKHGQFFFNQIDIRDYQKCFEIFNQFNPDVIFHLAGQVAMTTSIAQPRLDFEINALGTLNVLEATRNICPKSAFIYSSTNKVYGDLSNINSIEGLTRYIYPEYPKGLPESIQINFHSPYGCSKGAADQYVLDYARIYGLKTVVFRHSSMYGSRQYATSDQGWIGWFCKEAIRQSIDDKPIKIHGNGKQVRDLLYCDDMVSIYLAAAKNIDLLAGEAYNIGGGIENSYSLIELFGALEDILNYSLNWEGSEPRISDQLVFIADMTKIQSLIEWEPRVRKEVGLRKMISWLETDR